MTPLEITDNSFLRQFETTVNGHLAKIEYSSQERKVFLTKLVIPEEITNEGFKEDFIKAVLNEIQENNLRVVPTSPQIAGFLRKNRQYKEMLPVGIRIWSNQSSEKHVNLLDREVFLCHHFTGNKFKSNQSIGINIR